MAGGEVGVGVVLSLGVLGVGGGVLLVGGGVGDAGDGGVGRF